MKLDNCKQHAWSDDDSLNCYRIRHDDGRPASDYEVMSHIGAQAAELAALRAVAYEYEARIKRMDDNRNRLRANLLGAMRATGITHIESDDGILSATLYPDRDESVEFDEGATFPAELCNDPKPPTPSKTKIKKAILSGAPIAGALIVRHDRLTIK